MYRYVAPHSIIAKKQATTKRKSKRTMKKNSTMGKLALLGIFLSLSAASVIGAAGAASSFRSAAADLSSSSGGGAEDNAMGGVARREQEAEEEEAAPQCNLACTPERNSLDLKICLDEAFPSNENITLGFLGLPKVAFPSDGEEYNRAKRTFYGNRNPAVVVMAEDASDVVKAVNCAVKAGYKISPRGRNHHFQALSNMDGYVVIDCSLLCDPTAFDIVETEGDWILPGQKIVATFEGGAGCTNAVMLAAAAKHFDDSVGALYAIGTCPSVGITGYTTGGGSGDATPFTGWGADDVIEVKMVLWDGSEVTANKDENPDLFWATQGGGGGFGVITSLKTVVPQSPEPSSGEDARKFTYVRVDYKTSDEDSRKTFLTALQDYFYEVDPLESSKFGGGGDLGLPDRQSHSLYGIFLGSVKDFVDSWGKHGLLDENMLDASVNTTFLQNYTEICNGNKPCDAGNGIPSLGLYAAEFNSYGDMMLHKICKHAIKNPSMSQTTGDWCADLGIDGELCELRENSFGFNQSAPICNKQEVISALLEAASDPLSFINTAGPSDVIIQTWREALPDVWETAPEGAEIDSIPTSTGGLLIPKLDIDTLMDIAAIGIPINHLQHGAPMTIASNATAFPWRDTAIMTAFEGNDVESQRRVFGVMAKFYGDESKLQGYYNYMSPQGNPNWRYYYFGPNYERLTQIKLKYDPHNFFGNPVQVEPAGAGAVVTDGSSGGDTSSGSDRSVSVWYKITAVVGFVAAFAVTN